ncbi:hypothetical protein [Endozoicomonas sp. ONNA2]|uniref:hypothetical protein n=1 Tax=Endozoicomonas sp. ONNA2 TaxID=2828741 RepID=UPI00214840C5|nr:hypothetical protein [Endozoicomonas sp. ONNA2]
MNLNIIPPKVPNTDAPPTYQQAIVKSHLSVEELAENFILKAEKICQSNQLDITTCRKSLFARVIKQLNTCIPEPFILPIKLSVLTNPRDHSPWDWDKWQRNANKRGYDAIQEIGDNIGPDATQELLSYFLPKEIGSEYSRRRNVDWLLNEDNPYMAVSELMKTRCRPATLFIVAAIKKGLVEEALINKIYAQHVQEPASSRTHEASNSQPPDYSTSCNELEINAANHLAEVFTTMANDNGSNTRADRIKLMRQFTSILNKNYQCEISVLGINPEQFGNNPTEVSASAWSKWQMAVYEENGKMYEPRDEKIIVELENILKRNLTQNMLYIAFKSSPNILDLKFEFGDQDLYSKDLLENSFLACEQRCIPVTKIITGLIEAGCLTQETIDAIYSLGIE